MFGIATARVFADGRPRLVERQALQRGALLVQRGFDPHRLGVERRVSASTLLDLFEPNVVAALSASNAAIILAVAARTSSPAPFGALSLASIFMDFPWARFASVIHRRCEAERRRKRKGRSQSRAL